MRLFGLILLIALTGCSSTSSATKAEHTTEAKQLEEDVSNAITKLVIVDGSGNTFAFEATVDGGVFDVEYAPTTPAMSSSGVYSGGSPTTSRADTTRLEPVFGEVEQLESDADSHAKRREMGTVRVSIERGTDRAMFIVRQDQADALLEALEPFRAAEE
jgi:hypothetical protein